MTDETSKAIKEDIARRIWREHDEVNWHRECPPHAREIVGSVLDAIAAELEDGNRVELRGFGVFEDVETKARTRWNPYADEPVEVPARVVPRWRPGRPLRERVEDANDVSAD